MSQLPITPNELLQLWVQELQAIITDAADIEEARGALQHLHTHGLSDPDTPIPYTPTARGRRLITPRTQPPIPITHPKVADFQYLN